MTINVLDLDDNPPVFNIRAVTVSVDENAAQGIPINMPEIIVLDKDQVSVLHSMLADLLFCFICNISFVII